VSFQLILCLYKFVKYPESKEIKWEKNLNTITPTNVTVHPKKIFLWV
jgi:hypothetical protein